MTAAPAPPLAPDLVAGLRRLKLARIRQIGPQVWSDRQDPALGSRGVTAHPHRGRDCRSRRVQPPRSPQAGRVPGHQNPARVPGPALLSAAGNRRLFGLAGMAGRQREPLLARPCEHGEIAFAHRYRSRRGRGWTSRPLFHRTNENTNGLLRQYFPKGTDLSIHSASDVADIAAALNGRPRKTLGWKTPAEAFTALLLKSA